jgi:hypothetical protein
MITRFFVNFVALSALACSGSTAPIGDDGGTGGGAGGPFGSLGSSGGSSSSGGSTSGSPFGGSTSGGSSSGGNVTACGINSTGNATCDQCIATHCCTQFHACAAEPQCKPLITCVENCANGDNACNNTCEQQYPNGVQPAEGAANCFDQNCKTACPQ